METSNPVIRRSGQRISHRWSFIQVALWVSLCLMMLMLVFGIWSYKQTNLLVAEGQLRTAKALAAGLSTAVEEGLITRNYALLESQLMQVMANDQVYEVELADKSGQVLSHLKRDETTHKVSIDFDRKPIQLPSQWPVINREGRSLTLLQAVGSSMPIGWIRLRLTTNSDDALLQGIYIQTLLLFSLGALVMIFVVTITLRGTYTRIRKSQRTIEDLNHSLESAAFFDSLTCLPNRHLLADRIHQALAHAQRTHERLAVCYIDLDEFKPVNDRFGHDVGDAVLVEIAQRLQFVLRQNDTVARVGGDEFVFLVSDVASREICETMLNRVLRELIRPIIINGHVIHISASIGVSFFPDDAKESSLLIHLADRAMYEAKQQGKNNWKLCESTMNFAPLVYSKD